MTSTTTLPAPPAGAPPAAAETVRSRAVKAMLACTARHGLTRTTLDDVAREAGCSRATLYRHFSGKQELVVAAVSSEGERIAASLRAAAAEQPDAAGATVAVIHRAATELASHEALRFLVAFEPEHVLPFVTFEGGDRLLRLARRELRPCFERFLPHDEADRFAEWVARVTLAYVCSPTSPLDMTDEATVRRFVEDFVLPGFLAPSGALATESSVLSRG